LTLTPTPTNAIGSANTLQVTYSPNVAAWLIVGIPSGMPGSPGSSTVTMQPSRTNLTAGVYHATVKFNLCYGADCDYSFAVQIDVTYTVS